MDVVAVVYTKNTLKTERLKMDVDTIVYTKNTLKTERVQWM